MISVPGRSAIALPLLAASLAACSHFDVQPAPGVPPAARPVHSLMQQQIIPASAAIFAAAGDPPSNDREWEDLNGKVTTLIEAARRLWIFAPDREPVLWQDQALALESVVREAGASVRARSPDRLAAASDAIYGVCASCHGVFLPHSP